MAKVETYWLFHHKHSPSQFSCECKPQVLTRRNETWQRKGTVTSLHTRIHTYRNTRTSTHIININIKSCYRYRGINMIKVPILTVTPHFGQILPITTAITAVTQENRGNRYCVTPYSPLLLFVNPFKP